MKINELSVKTKEELKNLLGEKREELRGLRFKISTREIKGVRQMREVKKTIARILTLLKGL